MSAWDRQEKETPKAFIAFCTYRDLGAGRTIEAAWHRQYPGRTGTVPGYWRVWSASYGWPARAAAYDAYVEAEARHRADADTIRRRAAMLKRHAQAGELLTSRGVEFFVKQKIEDGRTAISAIGKGVEVERQADGLPAWVVEVLTADESQLREWAAELDARRRAAQAGDPESTGDALSLSAGSDAEWPELQPAPADPEAG